ncbi:MAG: aspartate-semialdehyde dehydrogenase [Myxococcales bacterium]|nr:MAG: aspartate-semialdehyde dehydrogenase [Myxococcales bacterium]
MDKSFTVAVVGATGLVGQTMLSILHERKFPIKRLVAVASKRSAGKRVQFGDGEVEVKAIAPQVFEGVDIAIFSAGGAVSREWAPIAASKGAVVIDNSSAWRMDPEVPLCVAEVNIEAAKHHPKGIIANPNCSTMQMLVALKPIHDVFGIERIVVATYQAASGAGVNAVQDLYKQTAAWSQGKTPEPGSIGDILAGNLLMKWKYDLETGYHEEETKLVNETKKILGDQSIQVSPTAVRVPVETGHSEAVTLMTRSPTSAKEVRALLEAAPGVEVIDDIAKGLYPAPRDVAGKDPVLVGRIRDDIGNPGGVQLWIVGDNIRKGAALNAVQIAEGLFL